MSQEVDARSPKLMVIIPFRGEATSSSFEHLCAHLPAHLDAHGVDFAMLLVNQIDSFPFNRGMLTNVAFAALKRQQVHGGKKYRRDWFTYMAVHDIDRFPATENRSCAAVTSGYYTEPGVTPRVLHPTSYTGGVLLLRSRVFQSVNGFSNSFWGWGHEDNELYLRLRRCGLSPAHAPQIAWCMNHLDCSECKRAKPANDLASWRAETRLIAMVQERLHDRRLLIKDEGLSSARFTIVNSTRRMRCGGHSMRVLDVALHRHSAPSGQPCVADGGARDDGCTASMDTARVPSGVLNCARNALPHGSVVAELLAATRSRAMYNFRYEVDVRTTRLNSSTVYRVAVCAQEWQVSAVPDAIRYQPMWRATLLPRSSGRPGWRARLSKDFNYRGYFPCSLTPLPWANKPVRKRSARRA